jgi:hypothetical protein
MFHRESNISSKRINGTVCIVVVITILVVSFILNRDFKPAQENLLNTVFWGGVVLLGAGIGEKFIKK